MTSRGAGLTAFLYLRDGETIAFARPDLAVARTGSLCVALVVDNRADLTWLFWTKRCERIAWKGVGHAEEEVQRGADCDAASPD